MKNKIKIIFFTPFFGRTGSEVYLLNLLLNFDRSKFDCILYSNRKGVLHKELPDDVRFYYPWFLDKFYFRFLDKVLKKTGISLVRLQLSYIHRLHQPDIWYLNTMVLGEMVNFATKNNIPFITHFHELPSSFGNVTSDEFNKICSNSDAIIACSNPVKDILKKIIAPERIFVCHEAVDLSKIQISEMEVNILRKKLGIQSTDFVLVASGSRIYRKGYDLLLEIGERIKGTNVKVIWVGRSFGDGLDKFILEVIKKNFSENVIVIDEMVENYFSTLALADVFLLLSREDPYPLVMIEAAYLEKPILAFNSGGSVEFILDGMGVIVENFDLENLYLEIKKFEQQITKIDKNLLRKVAEEHGSKIQIIKWERIVSGIVSDIIKLRKIS